MIINRVAILIAVLCLFRGNDGQAVNWISVSGMTANIWQLCRANGSACQHSVKHCNANPWRGSSCETIAVLANFDNGLSIVNPIKHNQLKLDDPGRVAAQSSTMFLFGRYARLTSGNSNSVGMAISRDDINKQGYLLVCTQSVSTRTDIIASFWQYNRVSNGMHISQSLGTTVQPVDVSLDNQDYFACSWPLNKKNSRLNARIAMVSVEKIGRGKSPISPDDVTFKASLGQNQQVTFDDHGSAFSADNHLDDLRISSITNSAHLTRISTSLLLLVTLLISKLSCL